MRRVFLLLTVMAGPMLSGGAYAQGIYPFHSIAVQGWTQESDLTTFIGYSEDDAGQIQAQFYDALGQTIIVLDRRSLEQRVANLKQQGLSADESERVVRTWPTPRDTVFESAFEAR